MGLLGAICLRIIHQLNWFTLMLPLTTELYKLTDVIRLPDWESNLGWENSNRAARLCLFIVLGISASGWPLPELAGRVAGIAPLNGCSGYNVPPLYR